MQIKYILLVGALLLSRSAVAYSVLSHEAIIDVAWKPVILPMLVQKYPAATQQELEDAHAYAYGGAIAPDMGYYPFGNRLFSDLIHYVRNGDFIVTLLGSAGDVKEYAFALGMLAHYTADKYGHSLGINPAVAVMFPKLEEEYGPVVTYANAPVNHIRMEFGFDVLQTARGNYGADAYDRFISFEIADSALRRAFERNYSLDIDTLFKNYPRSVRTFRWAVKDIFPQLTRQAWKARKSQIKKQQQTATGRRFHYKMRRAAFFTAYGREVDHPGIGSRIVAGIIRILPKVGPLKPLRAVIPNPEAEVLFIRSFDTVCVHYRHALLQLSKGASLPNIDFDTGHPGAAGEYDLADKAYYTLLMKLKERHYAQLAPGLKEHILRFYEKGVDRSQTKDLEQRRQIQQALGELKRAKAPIAVDISDPVR